MPEETAANPPPTVVRLPTARPAPLPPTPLMQSDEPRFCAAGRYCVAYPVLGCSAKLSQHNTARFRLRNARLQRPEYSTSASEAAFASTHSLAEDRFCYGCRAAIADGAGLCATAHRTADPHAQGRS